MMRGTDIGARRSRGFDMQRIALVFVAAVSMLVGEAATAQQPASSPSAATGAAKTRASADRPLPEYTFKQLMDSIVDPSADVIWESVSTSLTEKGRVEKRPTTNEEWARILDAGIMLSESANLMLVPGRTRAYGGPIPARARSDFAREARALQLLADRVVEAARKKDANAIYEIGEPIDMQCDNCHVKYYDLTQFDKKKNRPAR
jgi:hypothetical protein